MLAGMINQGVTSGNTDFIIGQGLKMLVACCWLLDVAGTLYVPTMLAGMINQGVTSGNTDFIIGQGLKMLVACCCASGGALLGNYLCARLASYVGRDIRNAVYDASLAYSGGDL